MKVQLTQDQRGNTCIIVGDRNKRRRWMTQDEASKLAYRLMAFAAGQQASYVETVLD